LGDTVAAYARELEPAQWRHAENVRDTLSEAIARDETADALDAHRSTMGLLTTKRSEAV
jgi:hypothetical protein